MSSTKYVINLDSVYVYSEHTTSSNKVGVYYKNDVVTVYETYGSWYLTTIGWIYDSTGSGITTSVTTIPNSSYSFSIGDSVKITGTNATYTNDSSGTTIPDWVKDIIHTVSQISEDGTKALLGFPSGIRSWVYTKDLTLTSTANISTTVSAATAQAAATTTASTTSSTTSSTSSISDTYSYSSDVYSDSTGEYSSYASLLNGLRVKTLRGIFGMPYQYMEIADARIDSGAGSFGRKYAEKIVSRMPLLLMTPGTPEFLSEYNDEEKKGLMEYIMGVVGNATTSDLDNILKREGKYYTLKFAYNDYYMHVNPMCRTAAQFLAIGDTVMDGVALSSYDWSTNTNQEIHKKMAYKGSVAFYINSENQISESFSNNTSESMLASKVNGLSDMGRELNFIMGGMDNKVGSTWDRAMGTENLTDNLEATNDFTSKMVSQGNLINSITAGLQTVIAGGKLIFPEIWSDSSFSRSYDISIKLTTPDCDKLSWYLNICVPILHLVALTAPRQAGVNGYIAPFLVRAFYKGLFNCDMGIITNMSISKGQESSWTKEGLPTVVDVSFSIKDLYSAMAITSSKNIKYNIMNNITLMDYIANMCGININEPDIVRTIMMYYTQNVKNKITDFVRLEVAGGLDQWATNKVMKIFGAR